jgi:thiamine-phosphate pyrophosphorylase
MTMQPEATRLPNCRLFLVLPAGLTPGSGTERVAAALKAGDVASILLPRGPGQLETAQRLKPLCHAEDTALLLEGDAALVLKADADGLQIAAEPSAYRQARAILGESKIIGADCLSSRHLAMSLGELGADYVGFSGLAPAAGDGTVGWWSELFVVPCVALDPASEADARIFIAAGADFIRPSDAMWRDEATAASAVQSYNALIGEFSR